MTDLVLAQYYRSYGPANQCLLLFYLAISLLYLAAMWSIYSKAGKPGWACIIPIYNVIVLLDIAGKDWWWLFLMMIPVVNIVIVFIVYMDMAKAFGKGAGFGLGLIFLGPIFFPLLAFGDARYVGV